ncbi:MAG: DNA-processing protein DprA [Candidatus Paceibacterota bacterium]
MAGVPTILSEIPNPPKNIFIKGSSIEDNFWGIAIVGTRKASSFGLSLAKKIAKDIAKEGIPIISGLALGIDSAAHKGCLEAEGRTIAVLAGGIEKIYPSSNISLSNEIISSGGSLISEYKDIKSYPPLFLQRNRIVSGLSKGVVVIEAPFKSGAVSTANWAAEQGRDVFVVPGPVGHPNYEGSHKLIRDGARLVTSSKDILADLGIEIKAEKKQPLQLEKNRLSSEAVKILEFIKDCGSAVPVDKIISATKLEPQKALVSITKLCINGYIIETASGYCLKG